MNNPLFCEQGAINFAFNSFFYFHFFNQVAAIGIELNIIHVIYGIANNRFIFNESHE